MTSERLLYSRSEACELLGVSIRTLDRLIAAKKIHVKAIGDKPMVSRSELERFAGVKA